MSYYVCLGWTADHHPEVTPMPICNQHVYWSYQETDSTQTVDDFSMMEISKEEYEETVRLFGVVLFKGGQVDRNPKSIEEGFYEDYRIINLYEKKETEAGDEIEKDYELIQSKQFPSFWDAIRALHLFELPLEWKEMDFKGKVLRNGMDWKKPNYKLELVNK